MQPTLGRSPCHEAPLAEARRAYYDDLARSYDQARFGSAYGRLLHSQEAAFMREVLGQPEQVNDSGGLCLGCGTGRFMEWVDEGLDPSDRMLEAAARKFPGKRFHHGDACHTGLPTGSFRRILAWHLLMHLSYEEIRSLFLEVDRLAGAGALFLFDVPSKHRRTLLRQGRQGWHGATALGLADLTALLAPGWRLVAMRGSLFMPQHRIPDLLKLLLAPLDGWLCRSSFAHYASHLMVAVQKSPGAANRAGGTL
jgi:SAM-dependent methyltransferase